MLQVTDAAVSVLNKSPLRLSGSELLSRTTVVKPSPFNP